ncbi:MAG: hypothetical protein RBR05_06465 [Candidatus Methanomethylophilaceae archaeon]|nr:hypothetical protein [Candidatus Methanomethylophilaceae archaeon]MDY0225015.1 hypothetical protein [Candidatus Methanomethylophilaceae archaeon]
MGVLEYKKSVEMENHRLTAMTLLGAVKLQVEGGKPVEVFSHLFGEDVIRDVEENSQDAENLDYQMKQAEKMRAIMGRFDEMDG